MKLVKPACLILLVESSMGGTGDGLTESLPRRKGTPEPSFFNIPEGLSSVEAFSFSLPLELDFVEIVAKSSTVGV